MNATANPSTLPFSAIFAGGLFTLLLAGSTLVPVMAVPAWTTRDFLVQEAFLLLFAAVLVSAFASRSVLREAELDALDLLVLAGVGWTAFAAFSSVDAFESRVALRKGAVLALGWFALRRAFRLWPALFHRMEQAFLAVAAAAAVWVLSASLEAGWEPREGPFPNVNIAAGFLGLALLAASSRAIRPGDRIHRLLLLGLFPAWASTQSRGGLLSLTLLLGLLAVWKRRALERRLARWDRRAWVFFSVLVLAAAVAAAPMVNRLLTAAGGDPYAYQRLVVWKCALSMAFDRPLLGFGPGTFGEIFPYYAPPDLWPRTTRFAHNEYLQLAATAGWPAAFWALGLLGLLFAKLLPRLSAPGAFQERSMEAAAAALLGLAALHNLVDFTLHEWSLQAVLLLYVTAALREPVNAGFSLGLRARPRSVLAALLLALLLFLGWSVGAGSFGDWYARRAYWEGLVQESRGDSAGAEKAHRRALAVRPDFSGPWNSLGALEVARALRAVSPAERREHLLAAEAAMMNALRASPRSLTSRSNLVEILKRSGQLEKALALQRGLDEEVPWDAEGPVREAELLLLLNRPREALQATAAALDRAGPDFVPALVLRGDALARLGNRREAERSWRRAREAAERQGARGWEKEIVERLGKN